METIEEQPTHNSAGGMPDLVAAQTTGDAHNAGATPGMAAQVAEGEHSAEHVHVTRPTAGEPAQVIDAHPHQSAPATPMHTTETTHTVETTHVSHTPAHSAGRSDLFKTLLSLLMAVVVVSGAVITWRSTLDGEEALREDSVGLTADVKSQGAQVQSNADVYQNYQAYTIYVRNQETGRLIDKQIADLKAGPNANDADTKTQIADLQTARTDAYNAATASRSYFNPRYLSADGTYDIKREYAASVADKAKAVDLQPDKHFEEADKLRGKSNDLLLALLVLGGALLCYTLPGALSAATAARIRYPVVGLGLVLTLIAVGDALRVEFM